MQYYFVITTINDSITIVKEFDDVHQPKFKIVHFYLRILNTLNVFFSFNKLLVLLRFNERFALLIKLIIECTKDLF